MHWLPNFIRFCRELTGHYLLSSCILDILASAMRLASFSLLIIVITHIFTEAPLHIPHTGLTMHINSPIAIAATGGIFLGTYTLSAAIQYIAEQLCLKSAQRYRLTLIGMGIRTHANGSAALILSKLLNRIGIMLISLLFVAVISPPIMVISTLLCALTLVSFRKLIRLSPRRDGASEDAHDTGLAKNRWVLASTIANGCIITAIFTVLGLFRQEAGIRIHDIVLALIGLRMALMSCQAAIIHVQRLYRMRTILQGEHDAYVSRQGT